MKLIQRCVDRALADLTSLHQGAEVFSRLYNVPSMGSEPKYVAPGSIVFTNSLGGRVIAMAQPLRECMPKYYNQTLFGENYQVWITRLIERLGGACLCVSRARDLFSAKSAGQRRTVMCLFSIRLILMISSNRNLTLRRFPSVLNVSWATGRGNLWSFVRS